MNKTSLKALIREVIAEEISAPQPSDKVQIETADENGQTRIKKLFVQPKDRNQGLATKAITGLKSDGAVKVSMTDLRTPGNFYTHPEDVTAVSRFLKKNGVQIVA